VCRNPDELQDRCWGFFQTLCFTRAGVKSSRTGLETGWPRISLSVTNTIAGCSSVDHVCFPTTGTILHGARGLQHRLDIVRNLEGRFGFGFDLVDRDAVGQLDEREAFSPIDVENTLCEDTQYVSMILAMKNYPEMGTNTKGV
jgi:hypothetical protein